MQPRSRAGCHRNVGETATNAEAAAGFGGDSGDVHLTAKRRDCAA